ncbi:MAG: aldose epimerase family protein [Solirubrobacteraceae bacterium]
MSHVFRGFRRPLALAATGGLVAVLALGGSAIAAPASHHPGKKHASGAPKGSGRLTISSQRWGSVGGQPVSLFTLGNGRMRVRITNYGGVVQSIWVPNRTGRLTNVALGFPRLSDYVSDFTQGATGTPWPLPGGSGDTYFGAIIGRYANRIANGTFTLNGQPFRLDINNGKNTLHGGYYGWNTAVWSARGVTTANGVALILTASFPGTDGCDASLTPGCTGFRAPVTAKVIYTLTRTNQLRIAYAATNTSSNQPTVVNLTNHTYFNLGGEASGTVYNQLLALNSNQYTPINTNLIPESPYFASVAGTPFDFRRMHPIGQYIRDTNLPDGTSGPFKQLQIAHGYDHNWVLNGYGTNRLVAVAQDPSNGVALWTYTDQPGVQVYTGNFLVGDLIGTSGHTYRQSDAFTLETQHYPDSPNHIGQAGWPSVVLSPGATFNTTTAFRFGVEGPGFKNSIRFK